jgi:Tol biopolymer transport system component
MLAVVGRTVILRTEAPPEQGVVRFQIPLPHNARFDWYVTPLISPDGRHLALPVSEGPTAGGAHVLLRSLDSLEERVLPGTEGVYLPFWSADSRSIAFFQGNKLVRIDISGNSQPQTICSVPLPQGSGAWNKDNTILFSGTWSHGLYRVSALGGEPEVVIAPDPSGVREEKLPQFLPDGKRFLYLQIGGKSGHSGVYMGSLDSHESRMVRSSPSNASYLSPGWLIFGSPGRLFAQGFDDRSVRLQGEPIPISDDVGWMWGVPASRFSISENGVLAYVSNASEQVQLFWHNTDGSRTASLDTPQPYREISLSPDERKLAALRYNPETGKSDLWVIYLANGMATRITDHPVELPQWSPDGREVAFSSEYRRKLQLYAKTVGGSYEEPLYESDEDKHLLNWPVRDSLLYATYTARSAFYRLHRGRPEPERLMQIEESAPFAEVSPDGRWIAFTTVDGIYISAYPSMQDQRRVGDSFGPAHWSKDSTELFYIGPGPRMFSVGIRRREPLETSAPKALFPIPIQAISSGYAVTRDRKFIFGEPGPSTIVSRNAVTVVLNWTAVLKR